MTRQLERGGKELRRGETVDTANAGNKLTARSVLATAKTSLSTSERPMSLDRCRPVVARKLLVKKQFAEPGYSTRRSGDWLLIRFQTISDGSRESRESI